MPIHTGEYYQHTTGGTSPAIYYSFTPKSLTDGGFYTADEELFSLLIEAHRALGILEGITVNVPDKDILLRYATLKECHYSRQIDYPDRSLYSFLESLGCGEDIDTVQNIMQAQEKTVCQSIDMDFLRKIYTISRNGGDVREPIEFRSVPMFLTNAVTNMRKYSPTDPRNIFTAIEDMLFYLQKSTSDILIKTALVHYQFEMIHPFENYNGVMGRILASHILLNSGLRATPYLSISELLFESKNDYFDLLSSTQKGGGYARWIKYFTGIICEASRRSLMQIEHYQKTTKKDEEKIRQLRPLRIDNVLEVFSYWKRCLISDLNQPTKELCLSYTAVKRSVAIMMKLGILKQTNETLRYRRYMYSELADTYLEQPAGFK